MITHLGQNAKAAAKILRTANSAKKNQALLKTAELILSKSAEILAVNQEDLKNAAGKISASMLDRLRLDEKKIALMAEGLRQIANLKDPVGEISEIKTTARGLQVGRMRVPLGVIGMIYEARPNVSIDAGALCIKSGNAVILRGGSEALLSNQILVKCLKQGLKEAGLPENAVQLIENTDRALVKELLNADKYIDVLIPRGGKGLVELVSKEAKMPVIKHLDGICHIYIDEFADLEKALKIADNGKTYRYGICGATETLLVNEKIAKSFLPQIAEIYKSKGVEMRGCEKTLAIIKVNPATAEDWATEYLAPIISIKVVSDIDEAIAHIETYSSKHTDAIVSENINLANKFLKEVDSASVMINTPTCFADGFEYGLGAEIGISTDKIHWRGPVGLEGLTAQTFIIFSDGVLRQ